MKERKYKIIQNTLGFDPDLSGCKNIEDISAKFKQQYYGKGWSSYEGGNHVKLWYADQKPKYMPRFLFGLFAMFNDVKIFEAHTEYV